MVVSEGRFANDMRLCFRSRDSGEKSGSRFVPE